MDDINPWRRRKPSTASTLVPDSSSALGGAAQDLRDLDVPSSDSGLVLPAVVDPSLDVRLHRIEMALTMIVTHLQTIERLIRLP